MPGSLQYIADTARRSLELVRADAVFYLLVALYAAAGMLLLDLLDAQDRSAYGIYLSDRLLMFLLLMPMAAMAIDAVYVVHRFDRRRALAFRRAYSARRMACLFSGMALATAFMVFQGTFTSIKNVLPVLQGGFPYDGIQADIDAFLHFGVDPWRLLYAVGASDFLRRAVEWNYNVLWFLLCFGGLFFVVTSPRARAIRGRYVACFMLVWIVCGNLLAGLFLSAGPVYYGAVTGDEARFAEQIAFLARSGDVFSSAVSYQTYLWALHEAGVTGFGSGISAFPSVHVALVAMNALFLAEYSRRLGLAAFAYVALIVASSVYLAWHYAIDGYASIAVVVAIHWAVRRLAAERPRAEPAGREAAAAAS